MLVTMWCHTLFNGLARNHFNLRHPAPVRRGAQPTTTGEIRARARGVKFFNSPTPFQYYCHALFLIVKISMSLSISTVNLFKTSLKIVFFKTGMTKSHEK